MIGQQKGIYKERWIKNRTWDLIDTRRRLKQVWDQASTEPALQAAEENYQAADRRVKRSCRRDKRE